MPLQGELIYRALRQVGDPEAPCYEIDLVTTRGTLTLTINFDELREAFAQLEQALTIKGIIIKNVPPVYVKGGGWRQRLEDWYRSFTHVDD